jgi:hypothetical protein
MYVLPVRFQLFRRNRVRQQILHCFPKGRKSSSRLGLPILFLPKLRPHSGGNGALFLAERVREDRRHFKAGVSHPLGQHIERDVAADGVNPITMPQSLRAFLRVVSCLP